MRHAVLLACLIAASPWGQTPAFANACDDRVASISLQMDGRTAVVPVTVHGRALHLVLDTGANVTVLNAGAAAAMGLAMTHEAGSGLLSVGGLQGSVSTVVPDMHIGPLSIAAMTVAVEAETPLDGVLGLDVLSHFDVDVNYPAGKLGLLVGGCHDRLPPDGTHSWQEVRATRSIASGALASSPVTPYLMIPVTLNGVSTLAMLDTGAMAGSLVSTAFAASIGVRAASLARDPAFDVHGFGTATQLRWHRFAEMVVAREAVRVPLLLVGGEQQAFPLVLGWDYFATHRVWFNFSDDKVFVAPAPHRTKSP